MEYGLLNTFHSRTNRVQTMFVVDFFFFIIIIIHFVVCVNINKVIPVANAVTQSHKINLIVSCSSLGRFFFMICMNIRYLFIFTSNNSIRCSPRGSINLTISFMASNSRFCLSSFETPQYGVMSPTIHSAKSCTNAANEQMDY